MAEPAIPLALQLLNDGNDLGDQFPLLREHQKTQQTGDHQPVTSGEAPAEAFVHEDRVRMQFRGQCDGLCLAWIEASLGDAQGNGSWRDDLEPRWQRGMGAQEFSLHGGGDHDPVKYLAQEHLPACEQQRGER